MSLETVGVNGRVYRRAFDHEEARALREADPKRWTYRALAAHFGVSEPAVARVLNPATRARMDANSLAWIRENCRALCRGGCGALVWTHSGRSGYCPACTGAQRAADGVRESELRCRVCGEWKPDDDFGPKGPKSRRCRRSHCRSCESEARRLHRQANLEYERAFDRERKRKSREATP